jgi:hypothetical protein
MAQVGTRALRRRVDCLYSFQVHTVRLPVRSQERSHMHEVTNTIHCTPTISQSMLEGLNGSRDKRRRGDQRSCQLEFDENREPGTHSLGMTTFGQFESRTRPSCKCFQFRNVGMRLGQIDMREIYDVGGYADSMKAM